METYNNYQSWTLDEIVFHNRNKAYGAYQLRIDARKNVRTGFILVFMALLTLIALSQIDWPFLKKNISKNEIETVVSPVEAHPLIPNTPNRPPPPPPPLKRPATRFVEMVVRRQEQIHQDETPPLTPKNDSADIGSKTLPGNENGRGVMDMPVVNVAPEPDSKPFYFVEQNPEFPGGDEALLRFIRNNTLYPQMERDNDIQGKVLLRFVVLEDGSVSNVSVMRGASPGLDKEAARVAGMLPKFKPGKQQGKPVKVYFNLPVVFKLQ